MGWIAVFRDATGQSPPLLRCFATFAEVLAAPEAPARVAVDMPIGLPERIIGAGRAAEQAVRGNVLKKRQSSVFTIPARAAVFAECSRFASLRLLYDAHARASALARTLSDPPRAISIQAFMIFPKIREIDALMTPVLAERVFETHPEVAFWRLNGGSEMKTPKKVNGRPNPAGIEERSALLVAHGYDAAFLAQALPAGAGRDDLVDAAVNALIAERLREGLARPFPDPPERDPRGLPIAIWA
jgi:predicted RNase H-like nuclease